MQLTKLEIKGFKSFGDKIVINFNEGVTAIVGPNGCGKSNVVDAIRWVLGEQSTRTLRSDKMENIIFNGSKNRKPSNLAEVSLTFDNTKNILPSEFTTITVTRKLFRNGDSEYRLNDVKCRLKDITDLFLDTGVASDTYSIIELKMIDEIINNKDNSRRNLFEEASGISKYKVRKKQTMSKLKDAEGDLSRVDDLLFEINKNLKSLESQAKKAERYLKLKEEYKDASLYLAKRKIAGYSEEFITVEGQETKLDEEKLALQATLAAHEKQLNEIKAELLHVEKNINIQRTETNNHIHKIRSYESEKKVKNEQMRFLREREQRLQSDMKQFEQEAYHVQQTLKRLQEEFLVEESNLHSLQADLQQQEASVEAIRGQRLSTKSKIDEEQKKLGDAQSEIYRLEKEIAVLRIQHDALQQEAERNADDMHTKKAEIDGFNVQIIALTEKVESQREAYESVASKEQRLKEQVAESEELIAGLAETLQKDGRLLDAKKNEYNLTKSLVDNLEGFPDSIKFLRKQPNWKKSSLLFSDILFCQEEYRVAIENYLEPIMNHYVVEEQQDAVDAINMLSDSSRGKANFFILEHLPEIDVEQQAVPSDSGLQSALDVITVEDKYRRLVHYLLHHVYLSQSEEQHAIDTPLSHEKITVLHRNGKFIKFNIGMSGGSIGLFEGKRIGRAKNLEILSKEIKALEKSIDALETRKLEESKKLQLLKSSSQNDLLTELNIQLNRSQNELVTFQTKHDQYQEFVVNSEHRSVEISRKLAAIDEQIAVLSPQLDEKRSSLLSESDKIEDIRSIYSELSESLNELSGDYNQRNIKLHQLKNRVENITKDIEYRENQQENLEGKLSSAQAEYASVKQEIDQATDFVDLSDHDLAEMYQQRESLEKGLEEMEKGYFDLRKQSDDLELSITRARASKENVDVLLQSLRDKKTALQIDLHALKERLSVEFSLDIQELLESEEEIEPNSDSIENLEALCAKLRKQLNEYGQINPMAKEAFDEMKERQDFILKEKNDLQEAKNSLLETISEIDQTARDKFMQSFDDVRSNFIRVFRSLFNEEDSCDIVLSNPSNPLESDIEILAQPKGKRPLSINQLSGGEKTLTSTALLFSLYLLKPAPFCIFDEVDAPLDDTNIDKFNNIIREFSNQSQFIVVSHNKKTIASTDIIYGVTMVEQGVSRVVAVDMRDVA